MRGLLNDGRDFFAFLVTRAQREGLELRLHAGVGGRHAALSVTAMDPFP